MKNIFKTRLIAIILCAALALSAASCSKKDEEEEFSSPSNDAIIFEATEGGAVWLPEGFEMPIEAGETNLGFAENTLYGGVNYITFRSSEYFTTGGSLTVNANFSLFSVSNKVYTLKETKDEYKTVTAALWQKDGDFAVYVGTADFIANGKTQTATFSALDPAAQYRIAFTYSDLPRTRIQGTFSVSGIASNEAPVSSESTVQ